MISDLRERPEFLPAIADRIWQAWWKQLGHPIEQIEKNLREMLSASPIPFGLVAYEEAEYMGSALIIKSDMDERPQYTPWIAAVWVEPQYRKQGIAHELLDHAMQSAFALGITRVYLCATRENRAFYLKRGCTQIEEDVGKSLLTIMIRDSNA